MAMTEGMRYQDDENRMYVATFCRKLHELNSKLAKSDCEI